MHAPDRVYSLRMISKTNFPSPMLNPMQTAGAAPSLQQMADVIKNLQNIISQLESRLAKMEQKFVVLGDGSVKISGLNIKLCADVKLDLLAGSDLSLQAMSSLACKAGSALNLSSG